MKRLAKKFALKFALSMEKPLTRFSAKWLKYVRESQLKESEDVLMEVGVLPIIDHYYQPMVNPKKHLRKSLRDNRTLPGIDFNTQEQLSLLAQFSFNEELVSFPMDRTAEIEFYYNNGGYGSGDAEYFYNIIRHHKPKRIIEIGSGNSTLMARNAILKNKANDTKYTCQHICIEPYEQDWLEKMEIELMRKKVEDLDASFFSQLEANDILFIDSSHIIRPQGDVLFEYLEILPTLKPGVLVHVHDIFTPKDYPDAWVFNHILWNEQYLLEAFLTLNKEFRILGALNYLSHNYKKEFAEKCPVFAQQEGREPGAFWMIRN